MKVRFQSLELVLLMALFVVAGSAFLFLIGRDALFERNSFRVLLGLEHLPADLLRRAGHRERLGGERLEHNYVGPLLVLEMLGGNIYLVMILNVCIFVYSLLKICSLLKLEVFKPALLLLLSPLTISESPRRQQRDLLAAVHRAGPAWIHPPVDAEPAARAAGVDPGALAADAVLPRDCRHRHGHAAPADAGARWGAAGEAPPPSCC